MLRTAVFIAVMLGLFVSGDAWAIPAFSKKYQAPCSLCHKPWPQLNDTGHKFKVNGYQLPDSEDGGETAKLSPGEGLFLDVAPANPPISFRLQGGLTLIQPAQGPTSAQENKFFCCVEGNAASVQVGGTAAPNIAYWLDLAWGKEDVEEGYLRFVNWFGPGLINVDVGAMRVVDYDVISTGREWFGAPRVALSGSPYNDNGGPVGLGAAGHDTGFRIYGRPSYGPFTYEAGVYTGSRITGSGEDDHDLAYTFMGRADIDKLAVSLRYWANKSGKLDQTVTTAAGETLVFPADRAKTDENTQEFILAARYLHPYFGVYAAYDRTSFSLDDRAIDGGARTLHQETINRSAFSLEAVWFVNAWFETGLAYGLTRHDEYGQTVDGAAARRGGNDASLLQWRVNVRPAQNLSIGLEAQLDLSPAASRARSDGTEFDAQNKLVLQWDLSL